MFLKYFLILSKYPPKMLTTYLKKGITLNDMIFFLQIQKLAFIKVKSLKTGAFYETKLSLGSRYTKKRTPEKG